MPTAVGNSQFQLSYQISPIILTGGSAANMPGGMLPILSLTQSQDFSDGLLQGSGSGSDDLDNYFAQFVPVGSVLISQDFGRYPFANQQVAANAVIAQPLTVGMKMICPVRDGGYANKLSVLTALRSTLADHNNSGGTYTIATPWYTYTDCLMVSWRDISGEETKQAGYAWLFEFEQPLLTLQQAQQAQNNLMNKVSSGSAVDGDPPAWSGLSQTVGSPPSLAAPSVIPAAANTAGTGVAAPAPNRVSGTDRFAP
jgi:hypothetical protein